MVPHIAAAIPQIKLLGPWGYAGLNTFTGNESSREHVYDNLRAQGLSPDEAYEKANAFLPNFADTVIRGGTNFGTMGLLNNAGNVVNQYNPITANTSPITQVMANVAGAMGVSGAGAAGEQALTNYRGNVPNDWLELLKSYRQT